MADDPNAPGVSETAAPAPAPESATAEASTEARQVELAKRLVDRFSIGSGAAGLIPLPFLDMMAVGGVQLLMLRRLSEIYGVPFAETRGKSIIASFAGSTIPVTSTLGVASMLKGVPLVGTAVATVMMPFAAAGATWVLGQVFIQHFTSGGTLLDLNLPDYREFIRTQREKWQARSTKSAPAD